MCRPRLPRKLAAVLAALAAVVFLPHLVEFGGIDHAGQQAGGSAPRAAVPAAETVAFVKSSSPGSGQQAAQTAAAGTGTTAGTSGGLCSVPGIGDIGGLLGFCSLGSSGLLGDLNNVCQPSLPNPEPAGGGLDAMVAPPASGKQLTTLYDQYGVAGNYWAAINLQCSDMTSLIGNNVAGMVFDAAKSLDRVTITVYHSAAGNGIVSWLQRVTARLITSLGRAIYFPYLSVVVILAAIWLAWQGLIRKRATRTIEGTVWMVGACAAAIFLIGAPAAVTGVGSGVSNGISQALDVAFARLPSPGPSSCVPVGKHDPEAPLSSYSYTSGSTVVDQNADELWTVLVCKPWLVGEFGTSAYATGSGTPTVVNTYGRSLLWAQAIATNEKATPGLIQAKQAAFSGIASSMQVNDPAIYPLFQGKEWTTRLEVAFAALFAALVAGVLVLLISVTLILLKLSFLLLLIVGPFFLLIGAHPGFGRVVALRWVEMIIGVLLKQGAVALVLSLLLYCYALIMGTSDAVLPWALKILMIALVTVAAFIYRKPFQHLFSAVGYGVIGSQERADADLARAATTARGNTVAAATAFPGVAAYRVGRWVRRNPGHAAGLALAATSGGAAAAATGLQAGATASAAADGTATAEGAAGPALTAAGGTDGNGGRMPVGARVRTTATTAMAAATEPPPLNLPARNGASARAGVSSGPASSVPGPAPGAWPLGRAVGSTSPQPGSPPPAREPVVARSRQAQPRGIVQGRAARSQPTPGQTGQGGRLRGGQRAGPAVARDRQRGASEPRPRAASGGDGRHPDSAPPASGRPVAWQGQPMTGPLTRPPEQSERSLPFWLRPMRRR